MPLILIHSLSLSRSHTSQCLSVSISSSSPRSVVRQSHCVSQCVEISFAVSGAHHISDSTTIIILSHQYHIEINNRDNETQQEKRKMKTKKKSSFSLLCALTECAVENRHQLLNKFILSSADSSRSHLSLSHFSFDFCITLNLYSTVHAEGFFHSIWQSHINVPLPAMRWSRFLVSCYVLTNRHRLWATQ